MDSINEKTLNSKPSTIKVIIQFSFLILTLSKFRFNRVNYLHELGCVIETIGAHSYQNLFMGKFEDMSVPID